MTPKEKAEDLVNRFRIVLMNEHTDCGNEILCTSISIDMALITVYEIMANCFEDMEDYWQEVEKELVNL